jgi:hypothetical protein
MSWFVWMLMCVGVCVGGAVFCGCVCLHRCVSGFCCWCVRAGVWVGVGVRRGVLVYMCADASVCRYLVVGGWVCWCVC